MSQPTCQTLVQGQPRPDFHTLLLRRVEALEQECQVLRAQYELCKDRRAWGSTCTDPSCKGTCVLAGKTACLSNNNNTLLSQLWQQAGQLDEFCNLLLEQERDRVTRAENFLHVLIRMTPTAEQQVELAQIQRDERVRLAELLREKHQLHIDEKVRLAEIAKDEKVCLAEVARDQQKEKTWADKRERVCLAQIAADEKVKLAHEAEDRTRVRTTILEKEVSRCLKELCLEPILTEAGEVSVGSDRK